MDIMPIIVDDIECSCMFRYSNKEDIYCIGSRKVDKYFFVNEKASKLYMEVISIMDGKHTIEQIKNINWLGEKLPVDVIEKIYQTCLKCNLITNDTYTDKKEFNEMEIIFKDIFKINILPFSNFCKKISNKVYIVIIVFMLCIMASSLLEIDQVIDILPWESITGDIRTLLYAALISSVSLVLHEISHTVAASKLGLSIKTAHLAVFAYMSLACYVRLPGIYFLKPKRRIAIWISGSFINFFLIAVAVILYKFMDGSGQLFLTTLIISNITIIISALVPFYISDGYFILATICKTPNLRKNIFINLKNIFYKRKVQLSSFLYIIYFLGTISFMFFSLVLMLPVVNNIIEKYQNDAGFINIVINNINIFIVLGILLISKMVRLLKIKFK